MATASQKMTEIRFLVLIRGARTPPPTMLTPVVWMPLWEVEMGEMKSNTLKSQLYRYRHVEKNLNGSRVTAKHGVIVID